MFTDIDAAIEEAQFLKETTGRNHYVMQIQAGHMEVLDFVMPDWRIMYSTQYDGLHTAKPNGDEK